MFFFIILSQISFFCRVCVFLSRMHLLFCPPRVCLFGPVSVFFVPVRFFCPGAASGDQSGSSSRLATFLLFLPTRAGCTVKLSQQLLCRLSAARLVACLQVNDCSLFPVMFLARSLFLRACRGQLVASLCTTLFVFCVLTPCDSLRGLPSSIVVSKKKKRNVQEFFNSNWREMERQLVGRDGSTRLKTGTTMLRFHRVATSPQEKTRLKKWRSAVCHNGRWFLTQSTIRPETNSNNFEGFWN